LSIDLETLLKTKRFLEEMSVSIRNILLASFPEMSREEREDIDNEVKLKLWRKAAGGKKIDNLRSYLWRVVYTTALDLIGERLPHLSLENLLAERERTETVSERIPLQDSAVDARERRLMLNRVLDSLPERRRAVIRLHLEGMDIAQIAAQLQWRENQVRHLLYRGLADVREMLRPAIPKSET
jgi:RNA polymerase sigma factor (sigma-70 family)